MIDVEVLQNLSEATADFVREASMQIRRARPADMARFNGFVEKGAHVRISVSFQPYHTAEVFLVLGNDVESMGRFPLLTEEFSLTDKFVEEVEENDGR